MSEESKAQAKIKWHQEQSTSREVQYYYCRTQQFFLSLVTNVELNLTRVDIYINYPRRRELIYSFEKSITKEEATSELQLFLKKLAEQLHTLSQVEF